GAYLLPRFNTGLVIASSRMKRGYIFEIVDLDTKAQAVEAGAHPRDQKALDGKMEELAKGLQEKVISLRAPEDLYDIEGLCRSSRFVVARIWSRNENGERDGLRSEEHTSELQSPCNLVCRLLLEKKKKKKKNVASKRKKKNKKNKYNDNSRF